MKHTLRQFVLTISHMLAIGLKFEATIMHEGQYKTGQFSSIRATLNGVEVYIPDISYNRKWFPVEARDIWLKMPNPDQDFRLMQVIEWFEAKGN